MTKLGLISVFLLGWLIVSQVGTLSLSTIETVLLCFAAIRLGRMIAYDAVMRPFRERFTRTRPHPSGIGMHVYAKLGSVIGELLACPICAGTWAVAGLVYLLMLWPQGGRPMLYILGAIGVGEAIDAWLELGYWVGANARHTINIPHTDGHRKEGLLDNTYAPSRSHSRHEPGQMHRSTVDPDGGRAGNGAMAGEGHER